ncbi:spore cortex biosynthesis protein YabQ [Bacillus solimangrovi]|uniref:Spore cortex biosynthesis protein YabQ n=1 Tax=Bacillus solimangrovi TaxID=1305675 RepID=A0A1E5LEY8_9BACI|nr:spore cortex biosynthesis protein YabQ [Bacillus solimangrovi]OEH92641.1 spore cortex biosynthesis protein YabQ [Bacillus solimangrovi]
MSLSVQFQTMLLMIAAGIWLGLILDTYRRFFNRDKREAWLVFLFDILFWVVQALIIFYMLLHVNHGQLRFYIFIAILCGFSSYQALFQRIYRALLERLIIICKALFHFLKRVIQILLIKPIIIIWGLMITIVFFMIRFVWKIILIVLSVIFFPFRLIGKIIWRILPIKVKKFIRAGAGNVVRLKNKLHKWIARIRP